VRLALKVVMQNEGDFVDVILLYLATFNVQELRVCILSKGFICMLPIIHKINKKVSSCVILTDRFYSGDCVFSLR
jgi:hypothetical protein